MQSKTKAPFTFRLATVHDIPIDAHAIKCGRFAVHLWDGAPMGKLPANSYFSISHIATGHKAANVQGKEKAIKTARAFDAALGAQDFREEDFAFPWSDMYRAWVEAAKEIVKQ